MSTGQISLIWLLIILVSFTSCQGIFLFFFFPKWMPASYLEAVASLSFVCLFETSIYILDKAVHNFCGKSNVYPKVIFTFHLHHPKQTMDSHAKTVTERAYTPRLVFPMELTSPSPLLVAFQSWVGAHTGQVWGPLHTVSLLEGGKLPARPGEYPGLLGSLWQGINLVSTLPALAS